MVPAAGYPLTRRATADSLCYGGEVIFALWGLALTLFALASPLAHSEQNPKKDRPEEGMRRGCELSLGTSPLIGEVAGVRVRDYL